MRIPGNELEQPGEGFLKLARRDLNPDLENQNLSCYQLHHGLIKGTTHKVITSNRPAGGPKFLKSIGCDHPGQADEEDSKTAHPLS